MTLHDIYDAVDDSSRESSGFSVTSVLKILGISRSGYYSYINHETTETEKREAETADLVANIFSGSHNLYGSPKIAAEINKHQKDKVSQKYIWKIMKKMGLKPKYISHKTITTKSKDFSRKLKNILSRKFNPDKPDAVWCTDITYIWTYDDGFVYLTSVIDLFSRKIVGWTLTRTMEADAVLECINTAIRRRGLDHPLIIHSDRGVQFTSEQYRKITEGMTRSYSKKGTPWDNACIESWHALLKRECIKFHKIRNYHEAKTIVFNYIEGFYNTVRIHSHCDYLSPDEYEKNYYSSLGSAIIAGPEIVKAVAEI